MYENPYFCTTMIDDLKKNIEVVFPLSTLAKYIFALMSINFLGPRIGLFGNSGDGGVGLAMKSKIENRVHDTPVEFVKMKLNTNVTPISSNDRKQ